MTNPALRKFRLVGDVAAATAAAGIAMADF